VIKPAHPPQLGAPSTLEELKSELARSLDDALFELADKTKAEKKGQGVLPTIRKGTTVHSMSLGTPRFCNDQTPPYPRASVASEILGADGSTPIACIEWSRVTFYREPVRSRMPKVKTLFQDQNLTRGVFNGYMSKATRGKVRKPISTWLRSMMVYRAQLKRKYDPGRAYPVFLTLTLPVIQRHGDAEINRACLQPFIQRLKRDYEIENYFWRAEAQENGNLHYHLLIDRYIPKRYLQMAWNMQIESLGYLTAYFERSGSLTPPSTEVHRIKDKVQDKKTGKWRTVDPIDYLLDYVMDTPEPEPDEVPEGEERTTPRKLIGRLRNPDGSVTSYVTRAIEGRVWGMSDTLRQIREPRAEATVEVVIALEEARERGILKRFDNEHATMYFGPVGLVLGRSSPATWKLIKEYYLQVFQHLYPAQVPDHYAKDNPPLNPVDLWLDLEHSALYHRLKLEDDSPVFATAQELEQWITQKAQQPRSKAA